MFDVEYSVEPDAERFRALGGKDYIEMPNTVWAYQQYLGGDLQAIKTNSINTADIPLRYVIKTIDGGQAKSQRPNATGATRRVDVVFCC